MHGVLYSWHIEFHIMNEYIHITIYYMSILICDWQYITENYMDS